MEADNKGKKEDNNDDEIELKVRRILGEEVGEHREFLQRQFRYIIWGIGVLFAAGAAVFVYIFGDSIDSSKEQLVREVDAKVIEYRINESFKSRLSEQISVSIANELERPDTRAKFDNLIGSASEEAAANVTDELQERIGQLVADEVRKVKGVPIEEILKSAAIPTGTVLAFDRQSCPIGWEVFKSAAGRVILGAGQGDGLTPRRYRETGGEEYHTLTLGELPRHDHKFKGVLNGAPLQWGAGRHPVPVVPDGGKPYDWSTGGNKPHNNMPPYVALLYCKKSESPNQ